MSKKEKANDDTKKEGAAAEVKEVKRFGGRGPRKTEFRRPTGVAVSEASEIFIADCLNERIVVCNTLGKVVRIFSTAVKGKPFRPHNVSLDKDGNVWVIGTMFVVKKKEYLSQNLLAQFSPAGNFLQKIDLPMTGVTSGIAVRFDIDHVRILDAPQGKASKKEKEKGNESEKSDDPRHFEYVNPSEIVFTDQRTTMRERKGFSESCVNVVTPDGTPVKIVGTKNTRKPTGVNVNDQGDLFVTDSWLHCVHVFREGQKVTKKYKKFGRFGSKDGQLDSPHGICLDKQGNVIVVDRGNWRLTLFNSEGKFVRHIVEEMPDLYAVAIGPNFLVVTCVGHFGTDSATVIPYSQEK